MLPPRHALPFDPVGQFMHSRANQSQNPFIMKSLVSFARSSQARAFARQYSGSNTPAVFFHWSSNAGSSRRGSAGFRLVQKMAASKIPKKGPALFFIQKLHIAM